MYILIFLLQGILYTIIPKVVRMPENQSSNPIELVPLYLAELMTASINTHQPIASYFQVLIGRDYIYKYIKKEITY